MSQTDFVFDVSVSQHIIGANKLAKTTAAIAIQNFEWRYMTLLFFNSTLLHGLNGFLKLYDKSVIVVKGVTEPRKAEDIRQFVIFGQDVAHITYTLEWMKPYNFDNTGRYIVICESENCNETEAVHAFWYHKITNVVFLKYNEGQVSGYTYFFSGDNCAMSAPAQIDIESCLKNIAKCVLYPEKFADLHKCPLIVSTFNQPPYMMNLDSGRPTGFDGTLLRILAEAMNATLKIMTPIRGDDWGSLSSTGTWFGSLGDVYYDIANISMTSGALTLSRFSNFQLSYCYNFVTIGWITNPTKLESASLKLLHPFNMYTHTAIFVTFIFVIVCSFLMRSKWWGKFQRRIIGAESSKRNNVVFYSWMICMGMPISKLPKKPLLLYIAFLWIWYTFMVRTMYQASLIHSLKTNYYASNVDSVEEMIKKNYTIGGGFALREYYINYPEVYNNFVGMNFSEKYITSHKISKGEKMALALNLEAVTPLYLTKKDSIHFVDQRIVISPTAIFFKKFSPLANSVNRNLRRLVEAGITERLYRIYVRAQTKTPKSETTQEPMTLQHYTGCYAILFTGWTVSFVVFICEIIFGFKNKTPLT